MILVVKHMEIEGPGTLGDFLEAHHEPFCIVELGAGESLPADPKAFKAVVVLGGPMNVDEEQAYPFLKLENEFIQKTLQANVPYLGICLGAQLLAKAAGAKVVKSPVKEIGWYTVKLTGDGKKDPLLKGFREECPVYQWHGDMFHVPHRRGRLLATSDGCPRQALKVGTNAYGLQFHVEVTNRIIKDWCEEYCEGGFLGRKEHAQSMRADYWKYKTAFDCQAQTLYRNFLDMANHA